MALSWIFLFIEGCICTITKTNINNSELVSNVVVLINIIITFIAIAGSKFPLKLKLYILLGYILRCCALWFDIYGRNIYLLPNSGQDSEMFAGAARTGFLYGFFGRGGYYAKYAAMWYRLFGVQRLISQYTNVLMFVTMVFIIIKIFKLLNFTYKDMLIPIVMFSFLPNTVVLNAIFLRETLVMTMNAISLYYFIKWNKNEKKVFILLSVLACIGGAMVHSGAVSQLLAYALYISLYDKKRNRINLDNKTVIKIIICIGIFFVLNTTMGDLIFGKFQGRSESADAIVDTASKYNHGGAAYDAGIEVSNSTASLIINTPIRVFYFLASPLPWDWRGLNDILAFCANAVVYIYAYAISIKALKSSKCENKDMLIACLLMGLSAALIFAWGVSNAGTALRHREKMIAIYIVMIGIAQRENRNNMILGEKNENNSFN